MSEESKSWYLVKQPTFNSGFEDDEFWAYGHDGFQEVLDSYLGSDVMIYDKRMDTEGKVVRAIVQQRTSDVYNNTANRQIICNIGILHCGQYVNFNGDIWLVSSYPDNNRIYEKAIMWKCRNTIHFISPVTGEIVHYPVSGENSTQYGTGERTRNQMNVGEDQHLVYIPYNEETIMIDDRFRFIMDKNKVHPTVYRVTRVDSVSYGVGDEHFEDGLIQWAVLEDQFNEATDNAELMVADYYTQQAGSSNESHEAETQMVLVDQDGDYKIACGETKQVQVKVMTADGIESDLTQYRLEYDFGDMAEVESENDSIVTIKASENTAFVGKHIALKVISDDLSCEATITFEITNW